MALRSVARPRAESMERAAMHSRDGEAAGPKRRGGSARGSNLKFTGLTQNLGQLYGSYRDFQSNCWVNLRILGQPCEFHLSAAPGDPSATVCRQPTYMIIPHHETFSTIIQPPYSFTKG